MLFSGTGSGTPNLGIAGIVNSIDVELIAGGSNYVAPTAVIDDPFLSSHLGGGTYTDSNGNDDTITITNHSC